MAGCLGPHAEVCFCVGHFDEIQGQFPMQSLYLAAQQEDLFSLCYSESRCHNREAYLCTYELSSTGRKRIRQYGYLCA